MNREAHLRMNMAVFQSFPDTYRPIEDKSHSRSFVHTLPEVHRSHISSEDPQSASLMTRGEYCVLRYQETCTQLDVNIGGLDTLM